MCHTHIWLQQWPWSLTIQTSGCPLKPCVQWFTLYFLTSGYSGALTLRSIKLATRQFIKVCVLKQWMPWQHIITLGKEFPGLWLEMYCYPLWKKNMIAHFSMENDGAAVAFLLIKYEKLDMLEAAIFAWLHVLRFLFVKERPLSQLEFGNHDWSWLIAKNHHLLIFHDIWWLLMIFHDKNWRFIMINRDIICHDWSWQITI